MNPFSLSGLSGCILILLLGFFVFSRNPRNRVYQLWLLFSLGAALWEFGVYKIGITTTDIERSILWWRIAYIGVILIPFNFVIFIYSWLNIKKRFFYYFSFLFGLLYLILDLSDIIFHTAFLIPHRVRWVFDSFYYNVPQPVYTVFVIFWLFIVCYSLYKIFTVYRVSTGITRSQIQYFLFAFIVAYGGGSTCYLVVYHIDFYPYLNFSAPFYHIIMAYAMVRHRLMDIKLVLRRSTVYLASVMTIFLPAVLALYIINRFYPDFATLISLILLILAVSVFPPIKNYFYRIANKYFFSSLYDSGEIIRNLTDKLRSTLEANKIYYSIADALKGAFHAKAIGILIYDEKNDNYLIQYNDGFSTEGQQKFPNDRFLYDKFAKQNEVLVVEEVKKEMDGASSGTISLLTKLKVEVLAPLNVKDKTIGLIALGGKESRDMYNDEDFRVLGTVGAQAAISIENALLYEETKNFTITLKQEVEKATAELRAVNIELQKLDRAKSDFISIASHQLRTPLSAIKGAISMVLEGGSFGSVTGKAREKLTTIYEYNERLIKLVADLLDLSHMEGGKMKFEFGRVDLVEIVQSVVEELSLAAQKKKLELKLIKPAENFWVRADAEKLRQVIMNLIDNAVKYTQTGRVEVALAKKDSEILFSVKDTGLGMTKAEIANLFQKFVRGANAPRLYTEGAGIGLYVAKLLVEAHQGQIWAESEGEGKGSTFLVKLREYK